MKKFAFFVLLVGFSAVMLAGCGGANNTAKSGNAAGNAGNAACGGNTANGG